MSREIAKKKVFYRQVITHFKIIKKHKNEKKKLKIELKSNYQGKLLLYKALKREKQ